MTVSEPPYIAPAPEDTERDAPEKGKVYRIGEVAELLQLKSYVLRFWESEFPRLVPLRTEKGQRLYTEEHVELLRRIQALLHKQGMTIDGARRVLEHEEDSRAGLANLVPLRADGVWGVVEQEENSRIGLANLVPLRAVPALLTQRELLQECVEELEVLRQLLRPDA